MVVYLSSLLVTFHIFRHISPEEKWWRKLGVCILCNSEGVGRLGGDAGSRSC